MLNSQRVNVHGMSQLAQDVYAYSVGYMTDRAIHVVPHEGRPLPTAGVSWARALREAPRMRVGGFANGALPVERAYGLPASFREE